MKIEHIGWCNKDNHDKVWGIIRISQYTCVTFWARRGQKLRTKIVNVTSEYGSWAMFNEKRKKGYTEISVCKLEEVYPTFRQDIEKTAVWAMLSV